MFIFRTKPAAAGAVAAAVLAVFQAAWAATHGGDWDATTFGGMIGALILALYQAGWIHNVVTPLARPRTAARRPLTDLSAVTGFKIGAVTYPPDDVRLVTSREPVL